MIEIRSKLRRWGNSFGVVVPQKSSDVLREGMEVTIFIEPRRVDLRKLVGKHKFLKSTDEIMREIDEDLDIDG